MLIPQIVPIIRVEYTGISQFELTFPFYRLDSIQVYSKSRDKQDEVSLVYGTDYTVTGEPSPDLDSPYTYLHGQLTLTASGIALVSSRKLMAIYRDTTQEQLYKYSELDPFPAKSHENGLSRAVVMIQELQRDVDRAIKMELTYDGEPMSGEDLLALVQEVLDKTQALADEVQINTDYVRSVMGQVIELNENIEYIRERIPEILDAVDKTIDAADRAEAAAAQLEGDADRAETAAAAAAADADRAEKAADSAQLSSLVYNVEDAMDLATDIPAGTIITLPVYYYPTRNILYVYYRGEMCFKSGMGSNKYQYDEVTSDPNVLDNRIRLQFNAKAGSTIHCKVVSSTGEMVTEIGADVIRAENAASLAEQYKNDAESALANGFNADRIVSGTIDPARLPNTASFDEVVVPDDTARFALTTAQVQNGDAVFVESTSQYYRVIDDTKLNSEAGYRPFSMVLDWAAIQNKPSAYPPIGHASTHSINGVDPLTPSSIGASPVNIALLDNPGSTTLPSTGSASIQSKIQALRDNVKALFAGAGGEGRDFTITLADQPASNALPVTGLVSSIVQTLRNFAKWTLARFDTSGNALKANALTTGRDIIVNTASQVAASFNGTQNISIGAPVTLIDAAASPMLPPAAIQSTQSAIQTLRNNIKNAQSSFLPLTGGTLTGDLIVASPYDISFGVQSLRQLINISQNGDHGIGLQTSTVYHRTSNNFAWFKGGEHSNATFDPGPGGSRLMSLNNIGDLTLLGELQGNAATSSIAARQNAPQHQVTNADEWDAVIAAMPLHSVYEFMANITVGVLTGPNAPSGWCWFHIRKDSNNNNAVAIARTWTNPPIWYQTQDRANLKASWGFMSSGIRVATPDGTPTSNLPSVSPTSVQNWLQSTRNWMSWATPLIQAGGGGGGGAGGAKAWGTVKLDGSVDPAAVGISVGKNATGVYYVYSNVIATGSVVLLTTNKDTDRVPAYATVERIDVPNKYVIVNTMAHATDNAFDATFYIAII